MILPAGRLVLRNRGLGPAEPTVLAADRPAWVAHDVTKMLQRDGDDLHEISTVAQRARNLVVAHPGSSARRSGGVADDQPARDPVEAR